MATTYRKICYDILTILKQNFNNKEVSLSQISYWVGVYGDRLLAQHIQKHDTQAYLQVFPQVPVYKDTVTQRQYIDIPASVYDFDLDNGIDYISYPYQVDINSFAYTRFTRTTPSQAFRLYYTDEEKPAPDNPYWYRADAPRIYLLGLECIDVPFVEVGLQVAFSNIPCDLDEEIKFPLELVPILQRQILDLGRFCLMIPADRINDGDYDVANIPKQKIISVNQDAQAQANAQITE
jgi:hypothetical protein